jgi:hypothetical protein
MNNKQNDIIMENEIKVKKVCAGWYKIFNKQTNEFLGEIDSNGSDIGEWVAYDVNNEWVGTCDTKKQAVSWFK